MNIVITFCITTIFVSACFFAYLKKVMHKKKCELEYKNDYLETVKKDFVNLKYQEKKLKSQVLQLSQEAKPIKIVVRREYDNTVIAMVNFDPRRVAISTPIYLEEFKFVLDNPGKLIDDLYALSREKLIESILEQLKGVF